VGWAGKGGRGRIRRDGGRWRRRTRRTRRGGKSLTNKKETKRPPTA